MPSLQASGRNLQFNTERIYDQAFRAPESSAESIGKRLSRLGRPPDLRHRPLVVLGSGVHNFRNVHRIAWATVAASMHHAAAAHAKLAAPWSIRAATPDDAEAIEALRVDVWKQVYRGLLPDRYLDGLSVTPEHVGQVLEAPRNATSWRYMVAEPSGQLIGYGGVGPSHHRFRIRQTLRKSLRNEAGVERCLTRHCIIRPSLRWGHACGRRNCPLSS